MSRAALLAYRKSLGPTPRLDRMTVRVHGLDIAVWTSPPVPAVPPLLLVNGGLLYDHALLWPSLAPLARARQVILYDQRGRGESAPPHDPLTARIEDDAADVGALRRALGIRRWDVLGHSWGGMIAMLGCLADQGAVRRLVTVNAVGPTSDWMPELHSAAFERSTTEDRTVLAALTGDPLHRPDPAVHGAYSRAGYRAWFADAELAAHFVPPPATSVTGAAVAGQLRREGYDWRDRLRSLSTPTLVLHGERDALPMRVALELQALLPRARHVIIPDVGHMPFFEAPASFFDLVDSHLASPTAPVSQRLS